MNERTNARTHAATLACAPLVYFANVQQNKMVQAYTSFVLGVTGRSPGTFSCNAVYSLAAAA